MNKVLKVGLIIGSCLVVFELVHGFYNAFFPIPWSKEINVEVMAIAYGGKDEEGYVDKLKEVLVSIEGTWFNKRQLNDTSGPSFEGTVKIDDYTMEITTPIGGPFGEFEYNAVMPGPYSKDGEWLDPIIHAEFSKYFEDFELYVLDEQILITTID